MPCSGMRRSPGSPAAAAPNRPPQPGPLRTPPRQQLIQLCRTARPQLIGMGTVMQVNSLRLLHTPVPHPPHTIPLPHQTTLGGTGQAHTVGKASKTRPHHRHVPHAAQSSKPHRTPVRPAPVHDTGFLPAMNDGHPPTGESGDSADAVARSSIGVVADTPSPVPCRFLCRGGGECRAPQVMDAWTTRPRARL